MIMTRTTDSPTHADAVLSRVLPMQGSIAYGSVIDVEPDGSARVEFGAGPAIRCDRIFTTDGPPPRLEAGDAVLVWTAPGADAHAVILGRIGSSHAPAVERAPDDTPDELVIEAKQNLTLKCGDGSITIRADGRILIKGRDLVSHAQRTNRIRGGSVAIN